MTRLSLDDLSTVTGGLVTELLESAGNGITRLLYGDDSFQYGTHRAIQSWKAGFRSTGPHCDLLRDEGMKPTQAQCRAVDGIAR